MDTVAIHSIWFVIISLVCALLGAILFGIISFKNPCRLTYAGIGAIIGLSMGPYIFAITIMLNIENSMTITEKEHVGV